MAQEKKRTNVLFQLKGQSREAAMRLDVLARHYWQTHPVQYPINGDELQALSRQGNAEILREAQDEMPDALAQLGLDEPAVQITATTGGSPRAYQAWPEIYVDGGEKLARYYMYSPVDYKGAFFSPADAINISRKGEKYENAVGNQLFAGGWLGNAPILDRPRQGIALPADYNPQTAQAVRQDPDESLRVFRAGGESLAAVEDFLFRQYAHGRGTSAIFDAVRNANPRQAIRPGEGMKDINASMSLGTTDEGKPNLRFSLRYSEDGEPVPLPFYPDQDTYKFMDVVDRERLLKALKDALPKQLSRRLADKSEGEPEDVYPDFQVGTTSDGRPEIMVFMRFSRDNARFESDTRAEMSSLSYLEVEAKNTAFSDLRRGRVPADLPRRGEDGSESHREKVRASIGMTSKEDGTIETRLLFNYLSDGKPVPDDLYPPPPLHLLTEVVPLEFRLAPNPDTPRGREFARLLAESEEPRPDIRDYAAIVQGPGARSLAFEMPEDRLAGQFARAVTVTTALPSVFLESFENDHFLVYRLAPGRSAEGAPPGAEPVSNRAFLWLSHDQSDRRAGITPPPPPPELTAELAALSRPAPPASVGPDSPRRTLSLNTETAKLLTLDMMDAVLESFLQEKTSAFYRQSLLPVLGLAESDDHLVRNSHFEEQAGRWIVPGSPVLAAMADILSIMGRHDMTDEAKVLFAALEDVARDPRYADILSPYRKTWRQAASPPDNPAAPSAPSP